VIYNNSDLKLFFTEFLSSEFTKLQFIPELHIIQVGQDFASTKYISLKQKFGEKIGVKVILHQFSENSDLVEIKSIIEMAKTQNFGLIFQLPVPERFQELVLETPLFSDVDLLGKDKNHLFSLNFLTPTLGAIDLVLKEMLTQEVPNIGKQLDLSGKLVAVIGQGRLVGSPLLDYLKNRNATIISLNKNTKKPQNLVRLAEIVICGAGSPGLVNSDWLDPKSVVIDAATTEDSGALTGDVDYINVPESVYLSTSPGGIGRITVMYIFYNLLKLAQLKKI